MERDFLFSSLPHPKVHLLSRKELEVLVLLASGMNSKDIAVRLDVMPKSVDNYKNRIAGKLELHGYGSLCRFAAENIDALSKLLNFLILSKRFREDIYKEFFQMNKLEKADMENASGGSNSVAGNVFYFINFC